MEGLKNVRACIKSPNTPISPKSQMPHHLSDSKSFFFQNGLRLKTVLDKNSLELESFHT